MLGMPFSKLETKLALCELPARETFLQLRFFYDEKRCSLLPSNGRSEHSIAQRHAVSMGVIPYRTHGAQEHSARFKNSVDFVHGLVETIPVVVVQDEPRNYHIEFVIFKREFAICAELKLRFQSDPLQPLFSFVIALLLTSTPLNSYPLLIRWIMFEPDPKP